MAVFSILFRPIWSESGFPFLPHNLMTHLPGTIGKGKSQCKPVLTFLIFISLTLP